MYVQIFKNYLIQFVLVVATIIRQLLITLVASTLMGIANVSIYVDGTLIGINKFHKGLTIKN